VGGGEPAEIPLAFPVERGIFSYVPRESALLMRGARGSVYEDPSLDVGLPLWLVQVPAGTPRRLGNLTASSADASPDGRHLVLARGYRLLIASIDGHVGCGAARRETGRPTAVNPSFGEPCRSVASTS
jgi:hypothetical protein